VAYFELRNRLQSIQGVIAPAVYGGVLRRILAYVDRERLQARNMSPMNVVNALRESSVFIPAGRAKFGNLDYQIFTERAARGPSALSRGVQGSSIGNRRSSCTGSPSC